MNRKFSAIRGVPKLGLEIGDVETLGIHIETKMLEAKDFGKVRATAGEE